MQKTLLLLTLVACMSCSTNSNKERLEEVENSTKTESALEEKTPHIPEKIQDTILPITDSIATIPKNNKVYKNDGIPPDGTYRYDMAFSESKGESRGEKVTVIIKGDSIKIVYEGDGNLKVKKGKMLDEGMIVKHKSGAWIIAHHKNDGELDVFGGCSGGPTIIDFINKKYWTC